MRRPSRDDVPALRVPVVCLLIVSAALTIAGIWLNTQFSRGQGPLRVVGPAVVVYVSLAAVGLVLVLWIAASATRTSGARGNRR